MQTLYCGNTVGDHLVQVTAAGVRLLAASTGALQDQWLPPEGLQINVASASPSQVQPCPSTALLVCRDTSQLLPSCKPF